MRVCVITRVTCNDSNHLSWLESESFHRWLESSQVKSFRWNIESIQVKSKIVTRIRVSDLTCYNTEAYRGFTRLGTVKLNHISSIPWQVRALQRPPAGVRMVIDAICIMKGVKPKKVAGDKPGSKVDDYWDAGKGLLQDPGKFLEGLFTYDKVNLRMETCSFMANEIAVCSIQIIHISSCISGSATCIEDIYSVANRTRWLCRRVRFANHCQCPKSSCTATNAWRISVLLVL